MNTIIFLLGIIVLLSFSVVASELINAVDVPKRTFEIDYENNKFLMNGQSFQYVSGSFHYFRALPQTWKTKLRTMRAAGLNAVSTYVEWSLHNPNDGEYKWDGIADLVNFIKLAQEEELYVLLRPGPYICGERDNGGFPHWLFHKYPAIQLRTADVNYLFEIRIWYEVLMTKMAPLLYGNGGPIILVQIENEYGSYFACDNTYMEWLRDETAKYVGDKAVLYTTDGPNIGCGKINGVFATCDFGPSPNISIHWNKLRKKQPNGPLVNSEYYPGWLTHWQETNSRVSTVGVTETLKDMLNDGASINFYMFFGGTNFGFTAGANNNGPGEYSPDITSYDYDAPMDEAGDPTPKYMAIRDVLGHYFTLPNITVPARAKKVNLGEIVFNPVCVILSKSGRQHLGKKAIKKTKTTSFEALNQNSGLVLYETNLPIVKKDPILLKVNKLRDRALVYIDREFVGTLSRQNKIDTLPVNLNYGKKLQILVESQGRINFNIANDFKGILGDVMLDGRALTNWNITGFPLEKYEDIQSLINEHKNKQEFTCLNRTTSSKSYLRTGPTIFIGEIEIRSKDLFDTYLDTTGWGKGILFVNGFNVGRYWPIVGPQITIYIPKELLRTGTNEIVALEYHTTPESNTMLFTDVPNLDNY